MAEKPRRSASRIVTSLVRWFSRCPPPASLPSAVWSTFSTRVRALPGSAAPVSWATMSWIWRSASWTTGSFTGRYFALNSALKKRCISSQERLSAFSL